MIINPYLVQPSIPAFTGLLDTYTNAAIAYSATRRLRTAYTGSLIRVRRSSDNAEQDIGYDANNVLDQAALTTFVGAGNGFVTTWYDQSGNGKNATQTTAIRQPQIVSSGSVLLKNGKPNINFTSQMLNIGTSQNIANTSYIATVGNSSSTGSASASFWYYNSNPGDNPELRIGIADGALCYMNGGYLSFSPSNGQFLTNRIHTIISAAGTTMSIYGNNTLVGSGTRTSTWNAGVYSYSIGGYFAASLYRDGDCQEYILYNSDKSADRTGITTNINTFYSIF
jgi:hypothetical protein